MRGHEPLVAMRLEKKRPQGVWIAHSATIDAGVWGRYADTLPWPEIEILPTEVPENLDLRFVVGLTVHVAGCKDVKMARRLHEALKRAAAKRVITHVNGLIIDTETGEWDDYVPE